MMSIHVCCTSIVLAPSVLVLLVHAVVVLVIQYDVLLLSASSLVISFGLAAERWFAKLALTKI